MRVLGFARASATGRGDTFGMLAARWLFWGSVSSILYTYALYPVMLAALARVRRAPPARETDDLPTVTLLIAAYNEQDVIGRKIENSLSVDYPGERLQILVAADGSSDDTPNIARQYAQRGVDVAYIPDRRGKVAAINRAMMAATGEIVVFSDANNEYEPSTLRELVRPFADSTVGGVVGAKTVATGDGNLGNTEGMYWKYESFIRSRESALGSCTGAVGEIFAIRRDLFEPPPEGIICDDFYIATRLLRRGFRVVYRPKARSIERVSPSPEDELKRRANIVAGRYQAIALAHRLLPFRQPLLVWQIVSHKFMRPLVPIAMVLAAAANVVLAPKSRTYAALFAGQVAFYVAAAVGRWAGDRGGAARLLYVPTYLVYANVGAIVGLARFVIRRRTMHLWERIPRRVGSP